MNNNNTPILVFFSKDTTLKKQTLYCPGSIRIDGYFESNIHSDGEVFIGSDATVKGLIKADNIYIYGTVNGDILAKNKVLIHNTGTVEGDIITKFFEIQENGTFIGKFTMRK